MLKNTYIYNHYFISQIVYRIIKSISYSMTLLSIHMPLFLKNGDEKKFKCGKIGHNSYF